MAKNKGEDQQDKLINLQAQQLAAQVANWAAQLEFQKERLRLLELPEMQNKNQIDIDRLAFDKGQAAWENAFKEANLTGTYNGQPTLEWLTQQAQLTGVLNGTQTLQGKLTDAQIKQMNHSMELANAEFMASTTGYINGRPTFDREKFMAGQAQDAWKFLSTLTGPSNAFKQARAISTMPNGMADLMKQWAGQYTTPGSTAVGSGGPASLGGLMLGAAGDYQYQPGVPQVSPGPNYMQGPPGQPDPQGGGSPMAAPVYPIGPTTPGYTPPTPYVLPTPVSGGAGGTSGGPPVPTGVIPNRGFPRESWTPTMVAAAQAWEASHPGWVLNGSQLGYTQAGPPPSYATPTETVPGQPASANESGGEAIQPQPAPAEGVGSGWAPSEGYMGDPVPQTGYADTAVYPTGQGYGNQQTYSAWSAPAYDYAPAGVQAPVHQWNYAQTDAGTTQVYPPGVVSPYSTPDISTPHATSPAVITSLYRYGGYDGGLAGAGPQPQTQAANAPGEIGSGYSGMLLPSQINAKNYANSYQYQKDLGWAAYEDAGWDKSLAQEAFERSLPKTGGPKVGSFAY